MRTRILVVDDDSLYVILVKHILEQEGYEVVAVTEGGRAVEAALTKRPGLILVDMRMPGVDGREVIRRLRRDTATRHIPILLVSAEARLNPSMACDLGADGYLAKPFVSGELIRHVRDALGNRTTPR